jgi:hypothetical protein
MSGLPQILLFILVAAPLAAATPEQSVIDTERAWSTAIVSLDTLTLEKILGDELSYGHASGAIDNKASYIGRIKSGAQKYVSFVYDPGQPAAPHIYGDTAVLIASATATSNTDGKPNVKHLRFLHVYVNRNGAWQLVAHQSVELRK